MSNEICVLKFVYGKVKRCEGLGVSIRASVVAREVRYVEHVKADTYTSATVSLGPRLHTNA